jgi:hypothetical protein
LVGCRNALKKYPKLPKTDKRKFLECLPIGAPDVIPMTQYLQPDLTSKLREATKHKE